MAMGHKPKGANANGSSTPLINALQYGCRETNSGTLDWMFYVEKTWHYHTLIHFQDENLMNVRDNRPANRFELDTEAGLALIDYHRDQGVVVMTHAEVPPALNGRGIGSQLVKGALDLVRADGEKVVPRCPFVATYIKRHAEYQSLLDAPLC